MLNQGVQKTHVFNKHLGTIINNDIDNILHMLGDSLAGPGDYLLLLHEILSESPGVFAQNAGLPEAVIYRTSVDSTLDRHIIEVSKITWPGADIKNAENTPKALEKLFQKGTDPLALTVEACRERGVKAVASYRMNAEDWYDNTWMLSDFGRAHPEYRMKDPEKKSESYGHRKTPGNEMYFGCLDPAIPEVYAHRMAIFTDAARNYDIDGIEFDFRRWTHMISDPLSNYPILTQMVRDTRRMLDETAKAKGRGKMMLGVRVGPSIETKGRIYDGGNANNDISSIELGLDIRTWVEEGIVDYICPSLFWPRWPGLPDTSEFAELVKGRDIGIYPTLFPMPAWLTEEGPYKGPIQMDEKEKLQRYRDEFCGLALKLYEDGADGISTFNWYFHLSGLSSKKGIVSKYGPGGDFMQRNIAKILDSPDRLKEYMEADINENRRYL